MSCFAPKDEALFVAVSHGGGGFMLDEGLQLAEFDEGGEEKSTLRW